MFVFSVGGGNLEKNVSPNLVDGAASTPRDVGATIVGIVGRDGGYTAQVADACVHRADGQSPTRHAALRSVPGGRLAPAGLASGAQGRPDEVGVEPCP